MEKLPELGGMGFSQVPAPEESIAIPIVGVEGEEHDAIRLAEFCKAFRHPLLRGTLYISEVDPREWFVELDQAALIFRGDNELTLMDTLSHLMPAGEA